MSYGYKTILELDGSIIDVTVCSYHFERDINENGSVISPSIGGTIHLSLKDIPGAEILSWGISHRKFKQGKIKVLSMRDEISVTEEEVSFENAACVNLKLCYERDYSDYFTTLLSISAGSICVGQSNCWISKEWNQ